MCNKGIGCVRSFSVSETSVDQTQALFTMDGSAAPVPTNTAAADETPRVAAADETPRVKFLCSFGGSILPRPLDGKLRYVGGETRIVSMPRDVTYEELMSRMRELFEAAALLKYQQPDEDLDALVSVVNDDDVTNMMEEYDKLDAAGDGFTRLRIFLFSHPDQDVSPHFDADERETERRYVDALNSMSDTASDFRKQQVDGLISGQLEKIHSGEQFYNPMNCEVQLPPFNLHHINVPHPSSGQHSQPHTQRYNEMEAPWSPAYYSAGHHPAHDPRPVPEFPSSPSARRYRMPFGDLHDKCMDRMLEEYGRHPMNHQPPYDHQPAFVDNVMWLPPGAIASEKSGYPGNLSHSHNVFDGNSICEHCRMAFQKNQALLETRYPDARWRHGQPHMEQSSSGNEFVQFSNRCGECFPSREAYMLNPESKLDPGVYSNEQNEHRPFYNESLNHERGWVLHHQLNHQAEEPRTQLSGASGRVNEHYMVDGSGMNMNFPFVHDGHSVSSNCINHDDPRYIHSGAELGSEAFHDQTVGPGPGPGPGHHMHIQPLEDSGIRYGNFPPAYGMDSHYQGSHGSVQMHALRRQVQNPIRGGPSYEASGILPQANGTVNAGFIRGAQEGSPRLSRVGMEDRNPWVGHCGGSSQKVFGFDGSAAQEYLHDHAPKLNSNILFQENQHSFAPEAVLRQPEILDFAIAAAPVLRMPSSSTLVDDRTTSSTISGHYLSPTSATDVAAAVKPEEKTIFGEAYEAKQVETVKEPDVQNIPPQNKNQMMMFDLNGIKPIEDGGDTTKISDSNAHGALEHRRLSTQYLSFLPELIASVKKAALEGAEEVKARAQANVDDGVLQHPDVKEASVHESEPVNNIELEHDSDNDHPDTAKIEPTKAEEEALARGLQTIKNDDLEEIRELGSGTYGAVFHGKWKGSDVAIKRIKASCFAGRPSERERLIADFWKEALILSSLHHPNVVSFYGIVRDGPDGTLATVTEFMVNGSLKQFLQKKDRTIDRRKRLIIAMDVSFGMEYLHGKNIVHFDLKCENLLVNMRDPHRPICKIGDLGLSKVKQHTLVSGGVRGTLPWMAPELLSGKSNMVTEKVRSS
ncbi:uncharacterized protein LOC131217144 isoform X2 [Magnolia sinica]|uniref:uncharacterized protein LOC131217144 isoform X2 n=1 Tax=Magnolia sinica TaxID=86752 RepID=UPI0026597E97|nr:uncharacterized protein LOC131217144 isoform X2 [Magnolia sinica]